MGNEMLFNKKSNLSFLTGTFNGAFLSFQSGISSSKAFGWNTLPDNICAPISDPFSNRHIE